MSSQFEQWLEHSPTAPQLAAGYLLAWIALIDGEISGTERAVIARFLGANGVADVNRVVEFVKDRSVRSTLVAVRSVSDAYPDEAKDQLVGLALLVLYADGRIHQGELHAVRFLADAFSILPEQLDQIALQVTGSKLSKPADLSRAAWWFERERAGRSHTEAGGSKASDQDDESDAKSDRSDDSQQRERFSQQRAKGNDRLRWARAVLRVNENASEREIKSAYRRLCQDIHPDRFSTLGNDAKSAAHVIFTQVHEAYEFLVANA